MFIARIRVSPEGEKIFLRIVGTLGGTYNGTVAWPRQHRAGDSLPGQTPPRVAGARPEVRPSCPANPPQRTAAAVPPPPPKEPKGSDGPKRWAPSRCEYVGITAAQKTLETLGNAVWRHSSGQPGTPLHFRPRGPQGCFDYSPNKEAGSCLCASPRGEKKSGPAKALILTICCEWHCLAC